MRKITIALAAAAIMLAAAPAFAQPVGTWTGAGEGWCPYPIPTPSSAPMYPWQEWKGRFEPNPDEIGYVFYGDWYDASGNHGTFRGKALLGTPEEIACQGTWTWWNEKVDPPQVYKMGTFNMLFRHDGSSCHGEWKATNDDALYHGYMKGYWVEP